MGISYHLQSGVAVHTLRPDPHWFWAGLLNTMLLLDVFMLLGLDFRDPPAVTRLTVYCWLHIPAQGDRDPGRLEHFWNKWMHFPDVLGSELSEFGC